MLQRADGSKPWPDCECAGLCRVRCCAQRYCASNTVALRYGTLKCRKGSPVTTATTARYTRRHDDTAAASPSSYHRPFTNFKRQSAGRRPRTETSSDRPRPQPARPVARTPVAATGVAGAAGTAGATGLTSTAAAPLVIDVQPDDGSVDAASDLLLPSVAGIASYHRHTRPSPIHCILCGGSYAKRRSRVTDRRPMPTTRTSWRGSHRHSAAAKQAPVQAANT